jgi:hypothetical protein
MRKILIISFYILYSAQLGFSQIVDEYDHSKYWYYRNRLQREFLKEGVLTNCQNIEDAANINTANGYSIPAGTINSYNKDEGRHVNNIAWGDATLQLGWYIGMLATEYKLLQKYNKPTSATELELYYAMKAFERLDLNGESLYKYNAVQNGCNLNGFFIRDDVNQAFINQNFGNKRNIAFSSSDYIKHNITDVKKDGYVSVDQISHMMMGFALVVKCMENRPYSINNTPYHFVQEAKKHVERITFYLKDDQWRIPIPGTSTLPEQDDRYVNHYKEIKLYSYGLAKAAERITEGKWGGNLWGDGRFEDPITFTYSSYWQHLQSITGVVDLSIGPDFRKAYLHNLAAIGHSWKYGLNSVKTSSICVNIPYPCGLSLRTCRQKVCVETWCYPLPTIIPIPVTCAPFQLPTIAVNTTGITLSTQGNDFGTQIYSLLNRYLNDDAYGQINHAVFKEAIHTAPCEGPHFTPQLSKPGIDKWRTGNRWEKPRKSRSGDADFQAEFNGLDYMLVYNLYYLVSPSEIEVPIYENELNREYNNFLFTAGTYKAFETLTVTGSSSVNTTAPVIFKAPSIDIGSGFTAAVGSNVTFLPGDISCNTTNNGYARISSEQTTQSNTVTAPAPSSEEPVAIDTSQYRRNLEEQIKPLLQAEANKVNWDSLQVLINTCQYVPLSQYLGSSQVRQSFEPETITNSKIYPNPFSQTFTLEFTLQLASPVTFSLTDIYGKQVLLLLDSKVFAAGKHELNFNTNQISSGLYFCHLKSNGYTSVQKLIKK